PIFPFEVDFFRHNRITCYWFGHPILDLILSSGRGDDLPNTGLLSEPNILGILPGSRRQEIDYLLPEFILIAEKLKEENLTVVFSALNREVKNQEEKLMKRLRKTFPVWEGNCYPLIRQARVLLSTCGTANLEIALLGKPFLVFYKTSWLNYAIAKHVVKLKVVSPVNLILGEKIVPEHLQFIDRKLVIEQVKELWQNSPLYHRETQAFQKLTGLLGKSGVTRQVAEFLISQAATFKRNR
ncbi:MAG: hypothetical protein NC823_00700, partial [Candidatus Omnitrophica bacterium]|nr:hypothetical protein [Candidatus Omnitrophota bacterium]